MTLRISSLKVALLTAALMLLALKGGQDQLAAAVNLRSPNLPGWMLVAKEMAAPFAAAFMAAYLVVCLLSARKLAISTAVVGYVLCLCLYYLRSALLGSESESNVIAIGIAVMTGLGVSGDVARSESANPRAPAWYVAFGRFFSLYVLMSFALFLLGYGMFGSRFAGATYHPNAHGFLAALASCYFMISVSRGPRSRRESVICYGLLLLSLLMVVASGSRASVAVTVLGAILVFPLRRLLLVAMLAMTGTLALFSASAGVREVVLGSVTRMVDAPADNRNEVWGELLNGFASNPFLGVGDTTGVSGNALLSAFSGAGIVGGAVFLVVLVWGCWRSLKLIGEYRAGRGQAWTGFAAALCVLVFAAGMFEGSLFDKFGPAPFVMIVALNVISLGRGFSFVTTGGK